MKKMQYFGTNQFLNSDITGMVSETTIPKFLELRLMGTGNKSTFHEHTRKLGVVPN